MEYAREWVNCVKHCALNADICRNSYNVQARFLTDIEMNKGRLTQLHKVLAYISILDMAINFDT